MKLAQGGTVTLLLRGADDALVRYAAELATPDAVHTALATIATASGEITFGEFTSPPPPWLLEYARQFLRSAWRARATTPYPQRIHRWRDAR